MKRVVWITGATALAGAAFGLLVGVLLENLWLWTLLVAGVGVAVGLSLAYGFLPESKLLEVQ